MRFFGKTDCHQIGRLILNKITELQDGQFPEKEFVRFFDEHITRFMDRLYPTAAFLFHDRDEGNKWKALRGVSDKHFIELDFTFQLQLLAGEGKPFLLSAQTPILQKICAALHYNTKPNVRGFLFQFFQKYDYLILYYESNSKKALNKFQCMKFYLDEITIKLKWFAELQGTEERQKILQAEKERLESQLNETKKSLHKRVFELNDLLNVSEKLYAILDFDKLVNAALLILIGQMPCMRVFALVKEPYSEAYARFYSKGIGKKSVDLQLELDHPLIRYFSRQPHAILIEDLSDTKELFEIVDQFKSYQIEMLAPLFYSGRMHGILGAGIKTDGRPFKENNLRIFQILVNIISLSMSNARMYEDVKRMSFTDGMTNLNNYRYFEDRLREEISRAQRNKSSVSLLMIDIDNFKNYNDTLGHQAGDEALRTLAELLKASAREDDVVNRYGGEEFAVILPAMEKKSISILAERIRHRIEEHVFYKEHIQPDGRLTISLGGASFPEDAKDFETLVSKADQALYFSKENGRNKFTLYTTNLA